MNETRPASMGLKPEIIIELENRIFNLKEGLLPYCCLTCQGLADLPCLQYGSCKALALELKHESEA